MKNQHIRIKHGRCAAFLLVILALSPAQRALAQEDGKKQTIEITSAFKPVLRDAAKIRFNGTAPGQDTTLPSLTYRIPVQNLVPGLSPVTLKPITLDTDSLGAMASHNYLRAGYGNLNTPVAEAGFTLGAGTNRLNVFGSHISSKGPIEYQQYARTRLSAHGSAQVMENLELSGQFGYRQDRHFQYGYQKIPGASFDRSDLLRRYNTLSAEGGLRNLSPTEFDLHYMPRVRFDVFNDNRGNNETNTLLDLPLEKRIGENVIAAIGLQADLTRYKPDNGKAQSNNLFLVPLSVTFRRDNLRIKAGFTASWDNSVFNPLPEIAVEFPVAGEKWVLQGGWIGYYNKGSYMRFAGVNPFIGAPDSLVNNRMIERYVGFRGTLAGGFTYQARIGSATYHGAALYENDWASGRDFKVVYEEKLQAVQARGEIGYAKAERFSFRAALAWNGFNSQKTEDRAWGLLPLDIDGHLRWQIVKDLWLRADAYLWQGAVFPDRFGNAIRMQGALDLNAGLEFRITKLLSLWTRFNNLTNSKYQRWNGYQAFGFNMTGGVLLNFQR
jgi:hypothetical protein